ncbi:pyruvate kinase [Flagellimonas myxillae]|uniref:pyruvate kinase n=1 Tax=Flagellimonas myxillae TaxID=2942214 RepID=UPI00201F9EBC|nr:pyruvate kinase [Muricauda myxillae]MCL6267644.1 pyruvate kinase [Muricauda myxillae]
MDIDLEKLEEIAYQLKGMVETIKTQEQENQELLDQVCETYKESAQNLIHYGTFRSFDVRGLQKKLKRLGLSRFGNAEGNILGSLENAHALISQLGDKTNKSESNGHLKIGGGKKMLKKHSNQLFGEKRENRRVKIMVTQPTQAAVDYNLVLDMVRNGMDCARINCAHDDNAVWKAIVDHVRKAGSECGIPVKIAMDLAGPKIRTGPLEPGPKVKKFSPKRSSLGRVEHPAEIKLVPEDQANLAPDELPVPSNLLGELKLGDSLAVKDTRGKLRKLKVVDVQPGQVTVQCKKTMYVETGTKLYPIHSPMEGIGIGELPRIPPFITVHNNDLLVVTRDGEQGVFPEYDDVGNLVQPGSISCIPASVVDRVKEGEPILFDDGKIEGIIEKTQPDSFVVRITKARANGSKLRAEKGINFPTLDMGLSGLTSKDRKDLEFVAEHADIVNFSFVKTEKDVEELLTEMEGLKIKDKVSVILKIETRFAYRNLIKILLTAMKTQHIGVMIARGDLALEVGWKNMGKVQEEILSICGAAHVPVVWATQVLEGLAKKGLPSRSEITDISSSVRAECVMLNKGPYINEAIALLDEILGNMESLRSKNEGMWPKIDWM